MKTSMEIVEKAKSYSTYAYWYGGKGEKCSESLLARLSALYPKIYTTSYKTLCRKHITEGKKCIDCSGLVCASYGVPMVGTSQFDKYFTKYNGEPTDGMVVWREGHTGIFYQGYVIEARGIRYGVTSDRRYKSSDWTRIYYRKGVDYSMGKVEKTPAEYLDTAKRVLTGFYGTGEARKAHLKSAGFNYDKIQKIVNAACEKEKNG